MHGVTTAVAVTGGKTRCGRIRSGGGDGLHAAVSTGKNCATGVEHSSSDASTHCACMCADCIFQQNFRARERRAPFFFAREFRSLRKSDTRKKMLDKR